MSPVNSIQHSQMAENIGLLPIQPDFVYPSNCIFCIIGCAHPRADDWNSLNDGSFFNQLTPSQFVQVLQFLNPDALSQFNRMHDLPSKADYTEYQGATTEFEKPVYVETEPETESNVFERIYSTQNSECPVVDT